MGEYNISKEQKAEVVRIAAENGKLQATKYLKDLRDQDGYGIFGLKEAKDYIESITDKFWSYNDKSVYTIEEITRFWSWLGTTDIIYNNDEEFKDGFIKFFS